MAELRQERQGRVLLLTIDDPATRNALTPEVYRGGREAMALAREHGAEDHTRQWVFLMGGVGTPVAKRQDWKKHLDERAWVAGRMGRKFAAHTAPVTKPRVRF